MQIETPYRPIAGPPDGKAKAASAHPLVRTLRCDSSRPFKLAFPIANALLLPRRVNGKERWTVVDEREGCWAIPATAPVFRGREGKSPPLTVTGSFIVMMGTSANPAPVSPKPIIDASALPRQQDVCPCMSVRPIMSCQCLVPSDVRLAWPFRRVVHRVGSPLPTPSGTIGRPAQFGSTRMVPGTVPWTLLVSWLPIIRSGAVSGFEPAGYRHPTDACNMALH
ncbi:hypothetical protein LZ30DRAFT_730360 [Colletotrichum cereale]|nr:hypothetical protein LZ30DRAFT_730360 [Colletotrichum cereale]